MPSSIDVRLAARRPVPKISSRQPTKAPHPAQLGLCHNRQRLVTGEEPRLTGSRNRRRSQPACRPLGFDIIAAQPTSLAVWAPPLPGFTSSRAITNVGGTAACGERAGDFGSCAGVWANTTPALPNTSATTNTEMLFFINTLIKRHGNEGSREHPLIDDRQVVIGAYGRFFRQLRRLMPQSTRNGSLIWWGDGRTLAHPKAVTLAIQGAPSSVRPGSELVVCSTSPGSHWRSSNGRSASDRPGRRFQLGNRKQPLFESGITSWKKHSFGRRRAWNAVATCYGHRTRGRPATPEWRRTDARRAMSFIPPSTRQCPTWRHSRHGRRG